MKKDSVEIFLVPPHFSDPIILIKPQQIVEKPKIFKVIDNFSIK